MMPENLIKPQIVRAHGQARDLSKLNVVTPADITIHNGLRLGPSPSPMSVEPSGRPVGYRRLRDREEADNPSLVYDAEPVGMVWDAQGGRPRERTAAEKRAEGDAQAREREAIASDAATLRASRSPEIRALVAVLERAGVL